MAQMYKSGKTVSFKYNADGLRVQKVATSTGTTNYTLHGKNIVHMTQGSNTLHFFYDANNKPAIVEYNGTKYAYVHNLQGDIVAILDSNGTAVVQYKYDAWGKPISKTGSMISTLGKINPFRYRGYVYDEETGMYYLRSRYYSYALCRFLNIDILIGNNVYSYCENTPVSKIDPSGYESEPTTVDPDYAYPTWGVDPRIAEAIEIILEDPAAYSYSVKQKNGKYKYGIRPNGDATAVCCIYLMVGLMGGSKNLAGRYRRSKNKGELTSLDQLKPGMEVYQANKNGKFVHIGLVVMCDFGNGSQLAVFQSTAVANLGENASTIDFSTAPCDANAGPVITSLDSLGAWTHYGESVIDEKTAFFFNPKNKWYLFD